MKDGKLTPGPSAKDLHSLESSRSVETYKSNVDDLTPVRRDLPKEVNNLPILHSIPIDEDIIDKVVKFQAVTRGFLARQKIEHERILLSAQESGVLVALRNTVQGSHGCTVFMLC